MKKKAALNHSKNISLMSSFLIGPFMCTYDIQNIFLPEM